RELDVHVEDVALGQGEGEVGQRPGSFDGRLLLVVDVLDEAGQAEHVFGHALAPLTTRFGTGERFTETLRGAGQRRRALGVSGQRGLDAAQGGGVVTAELLDELAQTTQFVTYAAFDEIEPGLSLLVTGRQLTLAGGEPGVELLAVEHRGLLEGGLHGGIAL